MSTKDMHVFANHETPRPRSDRRQCVFFGGHFVGDRSVVSYFRRGTGHSFTGQFETYRSTKHDMELPRADPKPAQRSPVDGTFSKESPGGRRRHYFTAPQRFEPGHSEDH